MIESIKQKVNSNKTLLRLGQHLTVDFLVEVGNDAYYISVRDGKIENVTNQPAIMRPWQFAIRARPEVWQKFWAPFPSPGYHDIFAMTKAGHATVEGNLQPLMANLRYIKEVLAAPRRKQGE